MIANKIIVNHSLSPDSESKGVQGTAVGTAYLSICYKAVSWMPFF